MQPLTEDDLKDLLINPFYAVTLNERYFNSREPVMAKEDWVSSNAILMQELTPKVWLEEFLRILAESSLGSDSQEKIIDPYYSIAISERLAGDHPPLVDSKVWVEASLKGISGSSAGDWLWRLTKVLETGGPEAPRSNI